MDIKEALQLKQKGILNLDNCIFVDAIPEEEISTLSDYLTKQGLTVKVFDFDFKDIESDESPETTALKYLYTAQKFRDKVISSLDFYIIKNYTSLYRNYITEFLKKSNPQFLCWYVSYIINLNPMMFLTSKETENNYALVNIFMKGGITEAFEKGIEEIQKILEEKLHSE